MFKSVLMLRFWFILLLMGSLTGIAQSPGAVATTQEKEKGTSLFTPKDTLDFLNGDLLRGSFLSMDSQNGIRWQHSAIKQVLTINPAGIYKIRLQPSKNTQPPRQNCQVRLGNGDELYGNLIGADETNVELDTWYAGKLNLPRVQIKSVTVGLGRFSTLFEGPTSLDGWVLRGGLNMGGQVFFGADGVLNRIGVANPAQPANRQAQPTAWQYKDRAFYGFGNGSVGRDFKLPGVSSIEFDMAWKNYPALYVFFYTDFLEGYGGNGYLMQFSARNILLRRNRQTGASSSMGTAELPNLGIRTKVHVAIRSDRENRTVALFIDDTLIKQWTDNSNFVEIGTGVVFYLQGQMPMKISNLKISEWDGRIDDGAGLEPSPKEDLVKLVNKDRLSGTLKSIKDGKMTLTTPFATLNIPIERITQIDFAPDNIRTNPIAARDMRLSFVERGKITMQVQRWDDQQVVGSSTNFGSARFLPSAFSSAQFNLNKSKVDMDGAEPATTQQPDLWLED